MPSFIYKARDNTGKQVKGVMEAHTEAELSKKLTDLGYLITGIAEQKGPTVNLQGVKDRFVRIKIDDIIMITIQLANMITSGLALMTSLRTLTKQIENRYLRRVIEDVYRTVEMGSTFSDALSKHPRVFSTLFVSMVRAGEASGNLDVVLNRLAKFAEKDAELRQKVKSAFVYPIVLVVVGSGVVSFMVIFLLPQFVEIFTKAGIQLPLPTRVLQMLSIGLRKYWFIVIILAGGVSFTFKAYIKTGIGRLHFDRFLLHVPVLGTLLRRIAIARFTRTLATLIKSGVPILQALEIVEAVVGNQVISRVIRSVHDGVTKGEKIAQPLKISEEFPPDTIQMIAVGEETGNLDEMLNKISDFYEVSIEYSVKRLTSLLEPLFLVIMGTVVGFIVASLILPMFDLMKAMKK
ncbi:MAG: type II secretion system F family protein [bacterium]